jgi:hypothetical protein
MNLDFWNNPLVVSSLRVRYRRGGIMGLSVLWLLVLLGIGMLLYSFRKEVSSPSDFGLPWQQVYFLILYAGQWVVSCVVACLGVAASMNAEVNERTLDFQRIAALSPRQILLGKMLGEPIQAYLLALTSLPLAAWCAAAGVPGLTLPVLLLLYLNLFTSILLFSASGLVVRLELKDGKAQGGAAWFVVGVAVGVTAWSIWMGGASMLATPGLATASALLAPIPAYAGLIRGDAFHFPVALFGVVGPSLLMTPVCQLIAAAVFFRVMERRLTHPVAPALSKRMAYLLLAGIDVLTAGMLYEPGPTGLPTEQRIVLFCVIHLAAALVLIGLATPGWEALASWVWRYRGRRPWMFDLWLGERSPADLVGPTACAIGGAVLGLLVLWPAILPSGAAQRQDVLGLALAAWTVTSLLILLAGFLAQWLAFAARIEGGTAMLLGVVLLGVLDGVLHGIGAYYRLDVVRQMSASALLGNWAANSPTPLHPGPLLLLQAAAVVMLWSVWRRRLHVLAAEVDAQLQRMAIPTAR